MTTTTTTYKPTTTYRKDSRCVAGHHLGKGATCYHVPPEFMPQTTGKGGYVCPECFAARHNVADTAAVRWGHLSSDRIEYHVVVECAQDDVRRLLPLLLYTNKERQAQWYATETGFASPTYGTVEFYHRLFKLASELERATLTVELSRYGRKLGEVTVEWANRNKRGQYIRKKRRAGDLLDLIDRAAEPHRYTKRNLNR